MWNSHVDDSARGRPINRISIKSKNSKDVIEADNSPFIGYMVPMLDLGAKVFKYLNTKKFKLEESFTDPYVSEVYKSEHICTANKIMHVISYA